jgi:asparagine synthase (glutamine-hydrolysing)
MTSSNGRFVITFNGEIYNHGELRSALLESRIPFRGHSDTEVLLEAIAAWGLRATLPLCIGMFAFAVWDGDRRQLTLARDRLGIKPLYHGWIGDLFLFGSELKALRAHPAFRGDIDRDALAAYVQHSYVPAPLSIFQGVAKLPPGSTLTVTSDSDRATVRPAPYWSLSEGVESGLRTPFQGTPDEAVEELDRHLHESIRLRREADVPLGAFLSGGVDSTAVVALMQAQSSTPVRTFTIGFHEAAYNEAPYARAVAERLGTEHVECYVTAEEAREVIPHLPTIYDEPFADSSQIPTLMVARITREHVKVSLSGDGGDELFCGYDRYAFVARQWRRFGWLPRSLRQALAGSLQTLTPRASGGRLARKMRTLADILDQATARHLYTRLHTHWKNPAQLVIGGQLPPTIFYEPEKWPADAHLLDAMMYVDAVTYLPDDILAKVDRASMAVGLEARVPLLDHRVVAFAWSLPLSFKVREGQTKWLLRRLLDRYVPRTLVERPKVGFGVPIDSWLRGPLREWAEDLLAERKLRDDGFFRPEPIREKWNVHLSGRQSWHYYLWDVLMFQAWLDAQR